jgi:hypothetical protein
MALRIQTPRPHTNDSTAQNEEKEDVDGAENAITLPPTFTMKPVYLQKVPCLSVRVVNARIALVKVIRDNRQPARACDCDCDCDGSLVLLRANRRARIQNA